MLVAWLLGATLIGAAYAHSIGTAELVVGITQAAALAAFLPLLRGRG